MKLSYKFRNTNQLILILLVNMLLISCGTYQSAYNNDGIYEGYSNTDTEKNVIVVGEKAYNNYNKNYFTNELERLEDLEEETIFTDVDSYNSPDNSYEEDDLSYNTNPSWGNNDNNDVVVYINNNNNGSYWNNLDGITLDGITLDGTIGDLIIGVIEIDGVGTMDVNNGWGWNNGFNNWGYNPFWYSYHNNLAFGWGMYGGYNNGFGNSYNNNRYTTSNSRYGRRATYNNFYSRDNIRTRNSSTVSKKKS